MYFTGLMAVKDPLGLKERQTVKGAVEEYFPQG
jgi:hypothetical protein